MRFFTTFLTLATVAALANSGTVKKNLKKSQGPQKYIYFTVDDGPSTGTSYILNAMKEADAKATFFINTNNMIQSEGSYKDIVRAVQEGHIIGDHSTDHLIEEDSNNRALHIDVYGKPEDMAKKFGAPVISAFKNIFSRNKNVPKDIQDKIYEQLNRYVRLPFTNNWRYPTDEVRGGMFEFNCELCTEPKTSSDNSHYLADLLSSKGKEIYGWDTEWYVNIEDNNLRQSPRQLLRTVTSMLEGKNRYRTMRKNKLVILTHGFGFGTKSAADQLVEFIRLAKAAGYEFRTIDTYATDAKKPAYDESVEYFPDWHRGPKGPKKQ